MYKLTDLDGKKLIDVGTARVLGEIRGVVWDRQAGCAFVTDEGCWSAEKIFSVKDAVSLLNPKKIDNAAELTFDKVAYDTTGKYLGKLTDVEMCSTLKLGTIRLDDGSAFGRGKVYALGDVLLIRARTPVSKTKSKAKAQNGPSKGGKTLTTAHWMQNRRYGDFSFLIGKTVDKTITNFQGELMIKVGEKVTNTVLRQAKVSGKLIELCLHTK